MNRRSEGRKQTILGLAGAALFAAVALGLITPKSALADRVIMNDGRVIKNVVEIIDHGDTITLKFKYGEDTVNRSDVREIVKEESPEKQYEKAIAGAKKADELIEIAKKARDEKLDAIVEKAIAQALKLDPDCKAAHDLRGDKKVDGKWLPEREWKLKEGWKEDPQTKKLVSPEEWKKREKEAKAGAGNVVKKTSKEYEGDGKWYEIATKDKNYVIHCNSTKEVAEKYGDFMVQIRKAYDKVWPEKRYKRYWKGQANIWIFRNNEDFMDFAFEDNHEGKGVGGYYRPLSNNTNAFPHRIVIAFHGAFGTGDTKTVLAHECTHQLQHILCEADPDVEKDMKLYMSRPTWWAEGYATYFGDGFQFDRKGQLEITIPRMRLSPLQEYFKNGFMEQIANQVPGSGGPISKILRIPHHAYGGECYPLGWGLVYYFKTRGEYTVDSKGRFVPNKKGKGGIPTQKPVKIKVDGKDKEVDLEKALDDLFDDIVKKPPDSAFDQQTGFCDYFAKKLEAHLGCSVDALYDDWKAYILALNPPGLGAIDKVKKRFVAQGTGFEISIPSTVTHAADWAFNDRDCAGRDEAVRIENKKTGAVIEVRVEGNMEVLPLESDDSHDQGLKDEELMAIARRFPGSTPQEKKSAATPYESSFEFRYGGTEQQLNVGQKTREGEQQVWHVLVGGSDYKYTFNFICMADKDKFDDELGAFEKIVSTFKLLEEPRKKK